MKKTILGFFAFFTVLLAQAQARTPVTGSVPQTEIEKVLQPEKQDQYVSIYPNPSNGVFTVTVSDLNAHQLQFSIMNVIGNEIYRETLTRNNGTFSKTLDLNQQAKGLYYVKLEADNFSVVRRVVVK